MESKNNQRRNYAMDAMKLVFMLVIIVHHSGYLKSHLFHGYMAVDFFFMTSGYMLWRTLQTKRELSTGGYFVTRLKKLYPHYFFSFLVMMISTSVYRSGGLNIRILIRSIPELLLIQNLGIFDGGVNYPCWYMSVLIFASVFIFFLGKKLSTKMFNLLAVIGAAVSYSFILVISGGSMENFACIGPFYLPFWRGVAGLFVGAGIYQMHECWGAWLQNYRGICNCLEWILLATVLALMCVPGAVDGLIALAIAGLLIFSARKSSSMNAVSENILVSTCICYEYAAFLNHAFVLGMYRKTIAAWTNFPALINIIFVIILIGVYSVCTEKLISMIMITVRGKKHNQ